MLVVAEIVKCPNDGAHTIKPLFEVEDKWKVMAFGTKLVTLESALEAVEAARIESEVINTGLVSRVLALEEGLKSAIEPLALYKAYGWPDRAGVLLKARELLENKHE